MNTLDKKILDTFKDLAIENIKTMLNNDWVKGTNYEKELKLMFEKKKKGQKSKR